MFKRFPKLLKSGFIVSIAGSAMFSIKMGNYMNSNNNEHMSDKLEFDTKPN